MSIYLTFVCMLIALASDHAVCQQTGSLLRRRGGAGYFDTMGYETMQLPAQSLLQQKRTPQPRESPGSTGQATSGRSSEAGGYPASTLMFLYHRANSLDPRNTLCQPGGQRPPFGPGTHSPGRDPLGAEHNGVFMLTTLLPP